MPCKVVNYYTEPNGEYIGRGSKWGNKYSTKPSKYDVTPCSTVEEAVYRFEQDLIKDDNLLSQLPQLIGKNLRCFCKSARNPHRICHGDVLAYYANFLEAGGTVAQIKDGKVTPLFLTKKVPEVTVTFDDMQDMIENTELKDTL